MKLTKSELLNYFSKRGVKIEVDEKNQVAITGQVTEKERNFILKNFTPVFELSLSNNEQTTTSISKPVKTGKKPFAFQIDEKLNSTKKEGLPSWRFRHSAPLNEPSTLAYVIYHEACTWLYDIEDFGGWFDCKTLCLYLKDKDFIFDSLKIRQALRELAMKGFLFKKSDFYSLIGDDDELADFLRCEKKSGKRMVEMCFYVPPHLFF